MRSSIIGTVTWSPSPFAPPLCVRRGSDNGSRRSLSRRLRVPLRHRPPRGCRARGAHRSVTGLPTAHARTVLALRTTSAIVTTVAMPSCLSTSTTSNSSTSATATTSATRSCGSSPAPCGTPPAERYGRAVGRRRVPSGGAGQRPRPGRRTGPARPSVDGRKLGRSRGSPDNRHRLYRGCGRRCRRAHQGTRQPASLAMSGSKV